MVKNEQAFVRHLEVFQLYLQVPFVMHVFLCQEYSMTVVAGLSQNLDGDLHVKVDFTLTALLKNTLWDNSRFRTWQCC